jgi:hypothetical protein
MTAVTGSFLATRCIEFKLASDAQTFCSNLSVNPSNTTTNNYKAGNCNTQGAAGYCTVAGLNEVYSGNGYASSTVNPQQDCNTAVGVWTAGNSSTSLTAYQTAYNTCYVGTPNLYSAVYCDAYAKAFITPGSTPSSANIAGASAAGGNVGNVGMLGNGGTPTDVGVPSVGTGLITIYANNPYVPNTVFVDGVDSGVITQSSFGGVPPTCQTAALKLGNMLTFQLAAGYHDIYATNASATLPFSTAISSVAVTNGSCTLYPLN